MKVFCSGTFDLLHSGHITFLKRAAEFGDLYVGCGSDYSVEKYKGKKPIYSQTERVYMLKAIRYVKDAWVNSGEGQFDYKHDLSDFDILIVNEEQHTEEKELFCFDLGIEYVILPRTTEYGLPQRSSTKLRELCK